MKKNPKPTWVESMAAVRIGRYLAARHGIDDMTEGDIEEVVTIAAEAVGLPDGKFNAFKLLVYATILEVKPEYVRFLTPEFLRKIAASE